MAPIVANACILLCKIIYIYTYTTRRDDCMCGRKGRVNALYRMSLRAAIHGPFSVLLHMIVDTERAYVHIRI